MKTITKFILGLPMLAFACGSIAFAQVQIEPVIPPDSALKGAAHPVLGGGDHVEETVAFPSGSKWHFTLYAVSQFGLVIRDASFQKSPTSPFLYVLFDGRLAEIFVPYHDGGNRFRDISGFGDSFKPLTLDPAKFPPLNDANGKPTREIIGVDKLICKQVQDYLAWMNGRGYNPPLVRYGQEAVYFSVLGAGNYAYIMEWTFRDDGTILVRAGSTGPKIDAGFAESALGHMHNFTWRLDIDLNGASANTAYWTSHLENLTVQRSTATDNKEEIKTEGSRVWDPEQFNTLEIGAAGLKNGKGHNTAYDLVPMRTGTARHSEPWTKEDFWVTEYNPAQLLAVAPAGSPSLPNYILPGKPTINKDLVIWYTASEHHEGKGTAGPPATQNSRDEDFDTVPVIWTGFALEPQNVFDGTPFYP
jgi:Cu2+-containing amine oxidase